MGYSTYLDGAWEITPPLTPEHRDWLADFAKERHEGEGFPDPWCPFTASDEGYFIEVYGFEVSGDYTEWVQWLITNFLTPNGYTLNGSVYWSGDDTEDLGLIEIGNSVVTLKFGHIVYLAEGETL